MVGLELLTGEEILPNGFTESELRRSNGEAKGSRIETLGLRRRTSQAKTQLLWLARIDYVISARKKQRITPYKRCELTPKVG